MKKHRDRDPLIPEAEAYVASVRSLRWKSLDPEAGPVVVLDTETTGMRVGRDRVLSVGLVVVEEGAVQLSRVRGWYLNPGAVGFSQSSRVHGILPEDVANGVDELTFLREFMPLVNGCVVVGHYTRFDAGMIDEMMKRLLGVRWMNPMVDTAQLAIRELPAFHRTGYARQPAPTLDEVCSQLGVYPTERHSAWGDAFTTAELYLLFCARMRQRLGRSLTLADLPVAWLHARLLNRWRRG